MANEAEVKRWKAGRTEKCPRCGNFETRPIATSGALPREWWCPRAAEGCGYRWQRQTSSR